MARTYIAAGNWKLNKTIAETEEFTKQLVDFLSKKDKYCEVIISPVSVSLQTAANALGSTKVGLSAQNCYSQNSGAFTGELSPAFAKDVGCSHIILGHSERRTIFKETDKDICAKVKAVIEEGLIPIFCIGETLEEREGGQVEKVLDTQITYGLEGVDFKADEFIIAYEPVWAIGTGKVASEQDAQDAHAFIRKLLVERYGADVANKVRILYGGSVKPDNVAGLIAQPDIDGALIGGASLKIDSFSQIIDAITSAG